MLGKKGVNFDPLKSVDIYRQILAEAKFGYRAFSIHMDKQVNVTQTMFIFGRSNIQGEKFPGFMRNFI